MLKPLSGPSALVLSTLLTCVACDADDLVATDVGVEVMDSGGSADATPSTPDDGGVTADAGTDTDAGEPPDAASPDSGASAFVLTPRVGLLGSGGRASGPQHDLRARIGGGAAGVTAGPSHHVRGHVLPGATSIAD